MTEIISLDAFREATKTLDWTLTPLGPEELSEIRTKYSYDGPNYQRDELIKRITEKLKVTLCGSAGELARSKISELHRTFLYRVHIEKTKEELFANVSGSLFHYLGNEERIESVTSQALQGALSCLRDKLRIYGFKVSDTALENKDTRITAVARSLLQLKERYGLAYTISNGNAWVDAPEFSRIGKEIYGHVASFGGARFLERMFAFLHDQGKYDPHLQRYHFPIPTSMTGDKAGPTVPWGYLFQLAQRAAIQIPSNVGGIAEEHWRCAIEDATALVCILDIEPYTAWETEFKAGESAFRMMSELALLESNFKISQIRASDLSTLTAGLFSWLATDEGGSDSLSYDDIKNISDALSEALTSPDPQIICKSDLQHILGTASELKLKTAFSTYSHNPAPNKDFASPSDYEGVDSFFKPFIGIDEERALSACHGFSAYAFIEATATYFRHRTKRFDDLMGDKIEQFVKSRLDAVGIKYASGKYKNSEGEDGEVDVAIEFTDLIGLIEIKKKSLTRKGRSGRGDTLLADLHKSLLDSQYQALGHEYSLHRDSCLNLSDGTKLELKGRRIEKITLTLFDFGAIQDRTIIKQLLPMYLQCRFNVGKGPSDPFIALNERCDEFLARFERFTKLQGGPENIPFFGSWFLSVPQFLVMLDDVSSPDDLKRALWNTKFVTAKTLDWYYEHSYMRTAKGKQ